MVDGLQTQDSGILVKGRDQMKPDERGVEYVVAYAKFVDSKDEGAVLEGVFFGGVGSTADEADEIAKKCVNSVRGGTILPKISPLDGPEQVIDALYDAAEIFERTEQSMKEAHRTIMRTQARKKK